MGIRGKIRFLLLILGACCIVTALSLRHSITKKELLSYEAHQLQKNLEAKEQIVYNFLSDPKQVENAKSYHLNENFGLSFIKAYRGRGINILVYEEDELKFWSSFRAFPSNPENIKEGSSFVGLRNGSYEVIKQKAGNYTLVFLIDVKSQFDIQNQYLENTISKHLCPANSLSLASYSDRDVYGIKTIKGEPLFEVKLKQGYSKGIYATIEVWLWIIGLFSFCLFFNSLSAWLAKGGRPVAGTLLLIVFFLAIRITDLEYGWFNHQFNLQIFSPTIFGESFFLPSLGDFLLNVIAITWVVLFMYTYSDKYKAPEWIKSSKAGGLIFHLVLLIVFSGLAFLFDQVFFGFIKNSKINFNITNIINLGWISWVSIIILCLVWFNMYLIGNIFMQQTLQLNVNNRERLILFLTAFFVYLVYRLATGFSIFFIAYALFIFIMAWNIYIRNKKFSIGIFAALFFCLAFITSIKYLRFTDLKEKEKRYNIAQKLGSTDDPKVISSIESLEKAVSTDAFIAEYFKQPAILESTFDLQKHVNKILLGGYLTQFEYNLYEFNDGDSIISTEKSVALSYYKDLVKSGSVKVPESNFFYRLNYTFGYQNYFGIIPIFVDNRILGTLVIDLKSPQYNYNSQLPEILADGKIKSEDDYSSYSFAFYSSGKLINQSGKFTYKLTSADFKGSVGKGEIVSDTLNYTHLVYMPASNKMIVISKEKVSYVARLATLSFFFLVFIIFSITLYALIWLLKNIDESWGSWFNINRSLMINANKILYKTRIQFSIVLSVVATLLIVGWTTYFYIREEYRKQQENFIKEKIRKVQMSYEKQIFSTGGIPEVTDQANADFNQFANINATYLNLFDVNGDLRFTSLSKLYDYGIIGRKMGPEAYINLKIQQKSEYINPTEHIGEHFIYASAYAPIKNSLNKTVAYIGLPYYANEADYQSKIGLFINTLINIYALVFVAIGILAVFLANQITSPLTFIQDSIRKTKLGQKNQPIQWSRHDEIGSLIKEYNKMISALEESATKLARSERESAWREMAKQVAHEIKNPLTPLKLGVQLLEKSWREKDPNFEKKFERFNKSFIEQIDSLSTIASEFSNFAKMPDTKLEKLQLLPIIEQARDVFTNAEDAEIYIFNHAGRDLTVLGDKDQLLRTFNNLLKNGIEAGNANNRCVIKIRIVHNETHVFIEVEDNGKGIDPYLQDKIFVPNFTTKSSGTGLGLAFVKQAVENAGGTVDFKSSADVGTTFYLSFPLS
ncbi:two-component system nitrogen regulation sensor histidine kinase NtrY [Pedobacter africanus]|uniref:Nitrogen fixation/metabolism regulation signal transduction histidine kinase n=1 Tax=Pedobacter africanus TaxID=151894 RepID=A0ACC6KX70_9SPHI|nr:ATP-binding protein [Pedobacter africanus]MDR6783742.1 nitrogen fixation/metabolism regulation signal transduction histidine kinase [Pedobacter africanus]